MPKQTAQNLPTPSLSKVGFEDIVGHKQIIKRLQSIIKILQNPKALERFNTALPKGLLIYGPPSVGKSMLAKAFVKEAGLKYLEISGSKLFETAYIREIYDAASKNAPCAVILEDLDIKGLMQGTLTHVSYTDIAKILESAPKAVFTVATAQSLDEIDPAMTAAGILDFLIEVFALDIDARRFFIEKILQMPHDATINTERIVRYITGMSAMELERVGSASALHAAEMGVEEITEAILIEQINSIKYGHKIENKMITNLENELKMTAYHEASHAVLSSLLLPHIKIEQVTIAPRSKMLGFVSYNTDDRISNVTKEELFNDVCVLMAGQCAKKKIAGENAIDSGAIDDLSGASLQIYTAIANLGMDKTLGFINIDQIMAYDSYFLSAQIEKRFLHWVETAQKRTEQLVGEHWTMIEKLALKLIEKEIVESEELLEIIGGATLVMPVPESI